MKERKLDKLYTEFEKDYSGKSKEEMEKIVSDLEKEIAGKEASLEGKDEEAKENLSKDIEAKKKRLENVKGYTKNKEQIEGIRNYRDSLEDKLKNAVKTKEDSKKKMDVTEKALTEVEKKLSDEKYTMTLDQNQYNSLLEQKANYTSEIEKLSKEYCNARDRVEDLKSKISKCNLAWKSLFVNKDWDDIQRIATTDDKRYTRKIDEKNEPISEKKKTTPEKFVTNILENVQKQISKDVKEMQNDEKSAEESKALVPVKKESFWKKAWNKFKQFIRGDYGEESFNMEVEKPEAEKQENNKKEPEKEVESKATEKTDRDVFLEGLRKHVDVEYRKESKAKEEARQKEAHKAKQNEKDDEREI